MAFASSIAMGSMRPRAPKFNLSHFTGMDNTQVLDKEMPWLKELEERAWAFPNHIKTINLGETLGSDKKKGGIVGIL